MTHNYSKKRGEKTSATNQITYFRIYFSFATVSNTCNNIYGSFVIAAVARSFHIQNEYHTEC